MINVLVTAEEIMIIKRTRDTQEAHTSAEVIGVTDAINFIHTKNDVRIASFSSALVTPVFLLASKWSFVFVCMKNIILFFFLPWFPNISAECFYFEFILVT